MSDEDLTLKRLDFRRSIKAIDLLCRGVVKTRLPAGRLDRDDILKWATRRKRLDEFGDPRFLHFFDKFMELIEPLPYSGLGRLITRQMVLKALANRLMVERYVERFPEVERIEVRRPLFVVGFPRTGTTLLQRLLSLDEGYRSLKFWELHTPVPILIDRHVADRRRRIQVAERALRITNWLFPEMPQMHQTDALTPEECWQLFFPTFGFFNFDLQAGLYDWGNWLFEQDMSFPYGEYRRCLQLLAHQEPTGLFVLKCPEHMWFLDAVLKVFPDAGIVWTHRDPFHSVPSYCSMISLNRRMLYGRADPLEVGAHITDRFHVGVSRAMALRERVGEERFFDVRFHELIRDPAAMVRRIKAWHGMDHDQRSEAAVERWLSTGRSDARGKHRYSAQMFGLRAERIHDVFADYIERFQVRITSGVAGADR